jgi:glycyl-tRNA synthetase beta subunit
MQKHQKYFAVCDSNGQLLPYFIAVSSFQLFNALQYLYAFILLVLC